MENVFCCIPALTPKDTCWALSVAQLIASAVINTNVFFIDFGFYDVPKLYFSGTKTCKR
jgi:hypothetical protein